MTKNTKSFVLPLTFIGIMFFAIGFALGINSLLVPVLQKSLGISNTASYLIIAATFIPFLVFGYPAGLTIKAIGYKRTMSLSFFIFAIAFYHVQGGDQQIASRIACNEIDLLLFYRDPINAKPSEPNEMTLLRLCDVHNIPMATNIATAEVLIHGLERGDLDWRDIVHPQN